MLFPCSLVVTDMVVISRVPLHLLLKSLVWHAEQFQIMEPCRISSNKWSNYFSREVNLQENKTGSIFGSCAGSCKTLLLRSGSTERNCKKTWCAQKQCAILATDGWWFEKPHVCSEAIHHRREYPADPQERRGQQGPMANDHHHRILCVL